MRPRAPTRRCVGHRGLGMPGGRQGGARTGFADRAAFGRPVLDVLAGSPDVARAAFYDVRGARPRVVGSVGPEAEPAETRLVERVFRTRQRIVSQGLVVKPLRDALRGGVAGILVLRASPLRPWDRDYARYLAGLAATVGAALRDAVRLRTTMDALRLRVERSEEQTAQMREVALALQQAVLTEPPEPDHLQVSVHYQPAALDRDIGGDWYDGFVTPDGATTLVVGDVVGHDLAAAVMMGQLRGLVRAIGYDSGASPARVLERVDAAVQGLALGSGAIATVILARIEQRPEQRRRGARTVRWSSAGQLPPMLVRADGRVDTLTRRNDLPLGLSSGTVRTEHTVELYPADTLVLYTDGLVERRGHNLRDDLADLARALEGTHRGPIEEVVEAALTRMLPGPGEDDVALVVLRTGPEDAPVPGTAEMPGDTSAELPSERGAPVA